MTPAHGFSPSSFHAFTPAHAVVAGVALVVVDPGVAEIAKPVDLVHLMSALDRAVHSAVPREHGGTP